MRVVAMTFFYGWSGALLVLGGLGIFIGAWEVENVFRIDVGRNEAANFFNEYRFLKAMEFGFALCCLAYRNEIFKSRRANRLFVSMVLLGAAARAISIAVEGLPHWGLMAVTVLEFLTGLVVLAYARQTVEYP